MCRDGLLTSGLIASMLDDESIQKDIEYFESFLQIRDKISVKADFHDKVMEEVFNILKEKYEINQLDGIKINIDENTWILIRKSNTEDIIRVSSESNNKDMLESTQKEILHIVKNCYEKIK
tara:strand:- start:1048 stop:1410 length:363 start_codon:yes stop_codon:yes gene_type:complete